MDKTKTNAAKFPSFGGVRGGLPRYRRLDLVNSMPAGEQRRIARLLKCSAGHVSGVLNGKRNQTNDLGINIIRLAERAAEIELGKRALSGFKRIRV